ncbi:hypothetical protein FRC12_016693, partial [Ceratobasidium sp. 428]
MSRRQPRPKWLNRSRKRIPMRSLRKNRTKQEVSYIGPDCPLPLATSTSLQQQNLPHAIEPTQSFNRVMSGIILPLDPLLQRAVAIPDTEMDAPPDDTQTGNSGTNDFTPGADDPDEMRSSTHTPHPNPLHTNHSPLTSLTQYAAGIVTSKKLSASSDQELHQFATASEAEREMMTYGICAEIRDGINAIVSRMGAATIHPDLMKCIKSRSAAGFFSPEIGSYTAPAGAKRAKDLQNSIY